MATLEADGINGATLLGFLAAVGSLRLLAEKYSLATLWFDPDGDRARLSVAELNSEDAIVTLISARYFSAERTKELDLLGTAEMPKSIANDGGEENVPNVLQLAERASTGSDLTTWSFVTGLLCDGLMKRNDKHLAAETVLCAANGASHQKMFQSLRDLGNLQFDNGFACCPLPPLVTQEHLRATVTDTWKFADTVPADALGKGWMGNRKPTLRWDESAERLHALRLREPTADPEAFTTQLGAYALAATALPCFPTFPVRGGGMTAFTRRGRNIGELIFSWPLWNVPISLAAFLATHASGEALTKAAEARQRGVYRLMSVRRMTQDKGKLTFQSPEAAW